MPKIIPELREALIHAAKERILTSDSHDITIREIASDCNTAVGTVYNYFSSKDELLAAVMLEDWLNVIGHVNAAVAVCALSTHRSAVLSRPTARYGGHIPAATG